MGGLGKALKQRPRFVPFPANFDSLCVRPNMLTSTLICCLISSEAFFFFSFSFSSFQKLFSFFFSEAFFPILFFNSFICFRHLVFVGSSHRWPSALCPHHIRVICRKSDRLSIYPILIPSKPTPPHTTLS
jgi:hypothetical protein